MSQSEVSAYLRVPELPEEVRDAFFDGEITLEHVKILLNLEEGKDKELFGKIMEEDLSVKDSRAMAGLMTGELEPPDFFDGDEFESRLGESVDYRSTSRGARLSVRAEDEEELGEILAELLDEGEL